MHKTQTVLKYIWRTDQQKHLGSHVKQNNAQVYDLFDIKQSRKGVVGNDFIYNTLFVQTEDESVIA